MKKLFLLLATVAMFATACTEGPAFTPGNKSDYVIYYTSSNGNIIEPHKPDGFGANIISNKYEDGQGTLLFDAPVTSIGGSAFYKCTSLTSVTIPDSVTSIGVDAFYGCASLTSVYITDIAAWCNISFGIYSNPLRYAGNLYLNNELVTDLIIPDGVTKIGSYAFYNCDSLTSVTIPDSVTSIGGSAFSGCTSLTSVTMPDSVTSIGEYAFYYCDSLTSVTIPDSVTSIGKYAFSNCDSLTSVTIGNSVTKIGAWAFNDCTSLTSVTIPDSVTSIGSYAFYGCASLTSFYGKFSSEDKCCLIVDSTLVAFAPACGKTSYIIPDSVTSIGDWVFCGCDSLTSVTIPDSVTSIGEDAFNSCDSLTNVTIPDSVTKIGAWAFNDCTSLTSVTIPDSVSSIGNGAFSGCTSITAFYGKFSSEDKCCLIVDSTLVAFAPACGKISYIIPDYITAIGVYAFSDCTSLTNVTIPDSVTSIGNYAFSCCTSLTSVYCKPTTPPAGGSGMFSYNASGRKIYVPRASVDAYKSASYWSTYSSYIVGYDF
ncbi:MAG: leucine-rich repeat protein [Alistipes sp.]|nr:leucine-rich repeat protein [Alistipes sp.]